MPTAKKSAAKKSAVATKKSAAAVKKSAAKVSPAKKFSPLKKSQSYKSDTSPDRVTEILRRLRAAYPGVVCALHHDSAWQLVVATILSAQCTDVRVNLVTPELFRIFPTPKSLASAPLPAIEEVIRTTGFFRNKAKSIKGAAQLLLSDFNGIVPQTMPELLRLPGVARKTANVVLGSWFGIAEGIVVDTHVFRISHRLGLAKGDTPQKVEQELIKIIPRDRWIAFSHEVIHHGRKLCIARKPKCAECPLENLCHAKDKTV
jgi:endonuclease-3